MAGAGFGGPLLLSFTLIMIFITVGVKVSCLLRFTLAASSVAHKSPFGDSGLILCWSRIRKFVTHREHTDTQTEKAITEATLIQWITRLSGPTIQYAKSPRRLTLDLTIPSNEKNTRHH